MHVWFGVPDGLLLHLAMYKTEGFPYEKRRKFPEVVRDDGGGSSRTPSVWTFCLLLRKKSFEGKVSQNTKRGGGGGGLTLAAETAREIGLDHLCGLSSGGETQKVREKFILKGNKEGVERGSHTASRASRRPPP